MKRTVHGLFFLSGAAALAYETLWAKYLALGLGHTAHAYAVVMAAFLGGLALGNALLGPAADRSANRLRLYAYLELGIGLFAVLSPYLMVLASNFYVSAARAGLFSGSGLFALRLALAAAVLLPPTILMGGTLPALSRYAVESLGEMEASVSFLYFVNGAGSVLGAIVVGFWMIPALGLDLSTTLAATVNVVIGAVCLHLAKGLRDEAPSRTAKAPKDRSADARERLICWAVLVSGFVSLCDEVAWTRLLALVLGSSAYSFSVMLAAFIGGIALGSLIVARRREATKDPALAFGLAELGVAVALVATLPLYPYLPYLFLRLQTSFEPTAGNFLPFQALQFSACFLLTLLPAALIGATLPLATRAVTRRVDQVGAKVGKVFAFNTAGNVLGAAAAGLWLLPNLGLKPLLEAGLLLNWAIGAVVVIVLVRKPASWKATVLAVSLAPVLLVVLGGGAWDARAWTSAPYRLRGGLATTARDYGEFRTMLNGSEVIFYREDADASVAVTRGAGGELSLKLNGKADASTGPDMRAQVLLGQLPLLLKPDAKRVFMVGMGSGVSAGAALLHPIESLDLVEISPAVVEASRLFDAHNHRPLDDPRLRLHVDDAKTVLRVNGGRYDVIVSEPSNPWVAGIGGLFTEEFYAEASAHLADGGVMAQWFHLYAMTDDLLLSVLRTYRTAFPYVTAWSPFPGDLILIGSREPLKPDFAALEKRFASAGVKADLARVGVADVPVFLSLQMASEEQIRWLMDSRPARIPLNQDRFPLLEYEAPKAFYLSAEASILGEHDQRLEGDARHELYWSRYLAGRGPLTRGEFAALSSYYGEYPSALTVAVDTARAKRWPQDVKTSGAAAAAGAAAERFEKGERGGAAGEPLHDVDVELGRYYTGRSFLSPGDPSRVEAALHRLEKSGTVGPGVLGQKWGSLYAVSDPRKALGYYESVGAIAEKNHARGGAGVWVEASQLALKIGDLEHARDCARHAVRLDPRNEGAAALLERLLVLKP